MTSTRSPYAAHAHAEVDIEKAQGMSAFADNIIRQAFIKKEKHVLISAQSPPPDSGLQIY
eukprot:gene27300-4603_t